MSKELNKRKLRILVTGGNGLVGSTLVRDLLAKKYKIYAPSKKQLNLLKKNKINIYLKSKKINFVIHTAAKVGGIMDNKLNRIDYLTNNTVINNNIITASFENKIRYFLNISSSCMYPRNISGLLNENMINDGNLEPTNEGHAFSKLFSVKLCSFISEDNQGYFYKSLIPCNIYGDKDNFNLNSSHFIPAIINKISTAKLKQKNKVNVWGDGTPKREIMHVKDLSDGIIFCLKKFNVLPNLLNIGSGKDYEIIKYYKIVSKILNHKSEFIFDKSKPNGMKRKLLNVKKINKLGWKAKITPQEGLKKTTLTFYNNLKKSV